jgi:hypothetical protein
LKVRILIFFTILFSSTFLFAQTDETEFNKHFLKVKIGMTEAQVKKEIGNPPIIENFKTLKIGTKDTTTYWRYENDMTVIFNKHIVEAIERNHNAMLQRVQEWADPKNKDGIKLLFK